MVQFGPRGLSLVVGANETGKSTALEALADLLWGIPASSGQTFLSTRAALDLRASLELSGGEPVDVVRRSTGLTREDTGEVVPPAWQTPLDSRNRWRESFGLSHTHLRDGGRRLCQGAGDLAELIFTARSGQVVRDLLVEVQRTANSLYKEHRNNKGVAVRQAYADYEQAQARVVAATAGAQQVQAAREARVQAEAAVARAQERRRAARDAEAVADQRARAASDASLLAEVQRQVEVARSAGHILTDAQLTAVDSAREHHTVADDAVTTLSADLEPMLSQRAAVAVDDAVLVDADQIHRLHLESEARVADGHTADTLFTEAAAQRGEAAVLLADLVGNSRPDAASPELLASVQVPADRVAQLDGIADELQGNIRDLGVKEEAMRAASGRLTAVGEGVGDLETEAVAAVREAYDAIETAGSAVSAQRQAIEAQADAARRREDALRLAGLPRGAGVPVTVPSAAKIEQAVQELDTANRAIAHHEQLTNRERAAWVTAQQDLAAAQVGDSPGPEELAEARRDRDASVAALIAAWLQGQPPRQASDLPTRVERTTARADGVADRLVTYADTAARRAELTRTLAQQEQLHATAERDLTAATVQAKDVQERWRATWHGLADAIPDPDNASEVRRHLDAARAADTEVTAAQNKIAGLQQQVESQTAVLAAALARAGRPRPDFDLDSQLEATTRLFADADAARERHATTQQLTELVRETHRERDAAADEVTTTQTRWQAVLRATGIPDDLDVPGWRRRRDIISEARGHHHKADEQIRAAETAQHKNTIFLTAVKTVAERHNLTSDDDPAATIALLAERVDKARADRTRAQGLDDQITQLQNKIGDKTSDRDAARDQLSALQTEVELSSAADLDRAVDRTRTLTQLTAEAVRLTDLVRAVAPEADIASWVAELAVTEPGVLSTALDIAHTESTDAEEHLAHTLQAEAHAAQALTTLTTGEGAAELNARAQEHLATVADRVERYLVARIQGNVLHDELEAYERLHASPLLDEAGVLLERLTEGRYVALGVTNRPEGGRGLVVICADGEQRDPSELSEGTADQAYLALRLAGIASLQQERRNNGDPSLPIVLDDVLMAFDDQRAAAALSVMAELAQQWQLIVFTHHSHLGDLAETLSLQDLTVSRLDAPPTMVVTRPAAEMRLRHGRLRHPHDHHTSYSPRPSHPTPRGPTTTDPGIIRAWARAHGYEVADRGRLPTDITDAYKLANP